MGGKYQKALLVVAFLGKFLIASAENVINAGPQSTSNRSGRVIWRIPGSTCSTGDPNYPDGYCDGWFSCYANKGSTPIGSFGSTSCPIGTTCCIVRKSCGGTINTLAGYFENRDYPGTTAATGECELTITKNNWDITQVKLDFLVFTLDAPDPDGKCRGEKMEVSGADTKFPVPTLCGTNKKHHMHLNFGSTDSINVKFTIVGVAGGDPTIWSIAVTQFRSTDSDKAPDGCLEYFTDPTGEVSSYAAELGMVGTQHLADNYYDICVYRTVGCQVEWSSKTLDIATGVTNGDPCFLTAGTDYVSVEGYPLCETAFTGAVIARNDYRLHVSFNADESTEIGAGVRDGRTGFIFGYKVC